jgi:hypothetical protein
METISRQEEQITELLKQKNELKKNIYEKETLLGVCLS